MSGQVLAVCAALTDVDLGGKVGNTAIDKQPIEGPVEVAELGLVPDHVADTHHHGGVDQAVYAYDDAEAGRWAAELGRELPPGWFGENLRVRGLPVTDALIGERWQIGSQLVLECTIPRIPCRTFAAWSGEDNWLKRFLDRGDVGSYLRVVQPGAVQADDAITVIDRPVHGVRVRDLLTGPDVDALTQLLTMTDLPAKVEREARKWQRRNSRQ